MLPVGPPLALVRIQAAVPRPFLSLSSHKRFPSSADGYHWPLGIRRWLLDPVAAVLFLSWVPVLTLWPWPFSLVELTEEILKLLMELVFRLVCSGELSLARVLRKNILDKVDQKKLLRCANSDQPLAARGVAARCVASRPSVVSPAPASAFHIPTAPPSPTASSPGSARPRDEVHPGAPWVPWGLGLFSTLCCVTRKRGTRACGAYQDGRQTSGFRAVVSSFLSRTKTAAVNSRPARCAASPERS